jgi:hypothetical protein
MDKCDAEVFQKGVSLAALDARSVHAEPWVRAVAERSGQRVDWHYSGGIAHVLVLGDHAKVLEVAKAMPLTADVRVMRWFSPDDAGCYRAGVSDPPPADALAIVNIV